MNQKLVETEDADLDFAILLSKQKKRYLKSFEGRDWDVTIVPAGVQLILAAWSYERGSGEKQIISIDKLLEATLMVLNAQKEDEPLTKEYLLKTYSLDHLMSLVNYVLAPSLESKVGEVKNSPGKSSETTS